MMKLRLLVVATLALAAAVLADVPLHCVEPQIRGTWQFKHTGFKYDHSVDCASVDEAAFTETLTVKLAAAPEIAEIDGVATSSIDDDSHWTMVYDESFELRFRKQIWWSRFHFGRSKHDQDCSKTMVGVAHEQPADGAFPDTYACFRGEHVSGDADAQHVLDPSQWRILPTAPVSVDEDEPVDAARLVQAINSANVGWTAREYDEEMMETIKTSLRRQGAFPRVTPRARANAGDLSDLPENFDWSDVDGKNYVGPVLNQGSCGSCYTFGALGSMNDRVRVKTGLAEQPSYAEQEILSCSHYSEACEGGMVYNVGKYVRDFGIVDDRCMSYHARHTECKFSCDKPEVHTIRDYGYIGGAYGYSTEEGMMRDIQENGPLAISFMVTSHFMRYSGGVFHCSSMDAITDQLSPQDAARVHDWEEVNHAVVIVGWGVDQHGTKFWRVRNSWGSHWGEHGYFRIERGNDCLAIESIPMGLYV